MPLCKITDIKVGFEVSYGRLGYKHHAVVVSIDETEQVYEIIHLSGDSTDSFMASVSSRDGKSAPIRTAKSINETNNEKTYYYTHDESMLFGPTVITERAIALIPLFKAIDVDYSLRKFNCQHFSSYCITGIPFCKHYSKNKCGIETGKAINDGVKITLDEK